MIAYTTIEERYCFHISKNIAVETIHYSNGSSKTECLSQGKQDLGCKGCSNKCSYFKNEWEKG